MLNKTKCEPKRGYNRAKLKNLARDSHALP